MLPWGQYSVRVCAQLRDSGRVQESGRKELGSKQAVVDKEQLADVVEPLSRSEWRSISCVVCQRLDFHMAEGPTCSAMIPLISPPPSFLLCKTSWSE